MPDQPHPTSIRLPAQALEQLEWIRQAVPDPLGQPLSRTDAVRLAIAEVATRLGWTSHGAGKKKKGPKDAGPA